MMFSYGNGMSGWGWFAMTVGMVLFWGMLIAAAVFVYRALTRGGTRNDQYSGPSAASAEQILAERYARGDIDEDEYQRRLATLTGAGPRHTTSV
jgi:putative membrane protein